MLMTVQLRSAEHRKGRLQENGLFNFTATFHHGDIVQGGMKSPINEMPKAIELVPVGK